ncbi:MAG: hypothetical protein ACREFF_02840 [Candidatus Udaeobacter sp.]
MGICCFCRASLRSDYMLKQAEIYDPAVLHDLSRGFFSALRMLFLARFARFSGKRLCTDAESAHPSRVINDGKVRTYDMGGNASTLDVANAIAEYAS